MQVFDIILILVYFIIVLAIGYISSKKSSKEGFLIANRKVKILPLAASLCAGLVGGGVLITTTALAFKYGLSFMWFYIGAALGFFIFPIFGKKIKKLGDKNKFYTLSDYFYKKFGNRIGLLTSVIVFIMFFAFVLVQFIAGGKILSAIMNIPYTFSVLIIGFIVMIYLIVGGFKAVIKTDYFQYVIMLILAIILIFSFKNISFSQNQVNLFSIGLDQAIGFLIIGAFVIFVQADVWQRAYASINIKSMKKSFYLAGILLLVFGLAIGMIGINAFNSNPGINPENALVQGFTSLLPVGFLGLALVLLFASIMSSLDTCVFVAAMNISNDYLLKFKKITKEKLESKTKFSIFVITILGVSLALLFSNVFRVVFALISIGLSLAPAMIGSFYWKLKEKAVFLSILTGFLSVLLIGIFLGISEQTAVISLPVAFIFLLIGQFTFKK